MGKFQYIEIKLDSKVHRHKEEKLTYSFNFLCLCPQGLTEKLNNLRYQKQSLTCQAL